MKVKEMFQDIPYFINVLKCRRRGTPPKSIPFLILWITNKCNLRCKMCDQWKTDPATFSQELPTEEWYSVIDSAARMHTRIVVISGGEPLLHPSIFQILGRIREKGMACHLCTNGTLINRSTIEKLKPSPPTSVTISLDSHRPEIHNELRGADCFNTVVEGIRLLRKSIPNIKIGINHLVCRRNFRDIERMIPFAKRLGVDQIKFDPIHTNLQHRHKPLETFGDLLFSKNDLPELRTLIRKTVLAASRARLHTNSSIFAKGIPHLYDGERPKWRCYAGYISCAIDPFGMVSPCRDMDGLESVRNKPLEKIWSSFSFQELRQRVNNCTSNCWDTLNTELSIRCSGRGLLRGFGQILKEFRYYLAQRGI